MTAGLVVGGGLGGLSAAVELAVAGHRVELLEAEAEVGGKLAVDEADGVVFDTGPSLLTLPGVFDDLFRHAGSRLEDHVTLFRPAPMHRYRWADGRSIDVFPDLEDTVASVRSGLGAEPAREFRSFVEYARKIWEAAAPQFLFRPQLTLGSAASLGVGHLRSLLAIDAGRTMSGAIRNRVSSPHLRMLFERYATYNGSDPRRCPATLNCIAYVELVLGGYGVEGGVYQLAQALKNLAEGLGVTVRTGTRVRRLIQRGKRVCGVELANGERGWADYVVANADSAHVLRDLLPAPQARRWPARSQSVSSMSGYNCIIRRTLPASSEVAHTILFPKDYHSEFEDIFDRDRPPQTPTVYCCAQRVAHRRQGWESHEPLFVMANAPAATPQDGPQRWQPLRRRVLEMLQARGMVSQDDEVVWERTPSGLAARFPGTRGALYGPASNGVFAAFRRLSNRSRSHQGLYFASGSVHPGGGMPLCVQSGRFAAQAAIEDSA